MSSRASWPRLQASRYERQLPLPENAQHGFEARDATRRHVVIGSPALTSPNTRSRRNATVTPRPRLERQDSVATLARHAIRPTGPAEAIPARLPFTNWTVPIAVTTHTQSVACCADRSNLRPSLLIVRTRRIVTGRGLVARDTRSFQHIANSTYAYC